jgi:chromosome segregation ATPase
MSKKPKSPNDTTEPTLADLQGKLNYAQQQAQTYRQQRDNITSQLQDLDAKTGIEITSLRQQLEEAQKKIMDMGAAKV